MPSLLPPAEVRHHQPCVLPEAEARCERHGGAALPRDTQQGDTLFPGGPGYVGAQEGAGGGGWVCALRPGGLGVCMKARGGHTLSRGAWLQGYVHRGGRGGGAGYAHPAPMWGPGGSGSWWEVRVIVHSTSNPAPPHPCCCAGAHQAHQARLYRAFFPTIISKWWSEVVLGAKASRFNEGGVRWCWGMGAKASRVWMDEGVDILNSTKNTFMPQTTPASRL